MTLALRRERAGDEAAIRRVVDEAFGGPSESRLIDVLRDSGEVLLSLVAEDEGDVVGHVLFSPVVLEGQQGMGLGPMAVTPARQRSGIGSRLIRLGLETLQSSACPFVVVLGHPDYYPRFGFVAAETRGVRCEWDVPSGVFRILVLDEPAMKGVSGTARYLPAFGETV